MPQINASLFKNDRKQKDNQPDYTGPGSVSKEDLTAFLDAMTKNEVNFDDNGNVKVRVAGWRKQSKSGVKYYSLSITPDDYQVEKAAPDSSKNQTQEEDLF